MLTEYASISLDEQGRSIFSNRSLAAVGHRGRGKSEADGRAVVELTCPA
jgi:hypothetical protein